MPLNRTSVTRPRTIVNVVSHLFGDITRRDAADPVPVTGQAGPVAVPVIGRRAGDIGPAFHIKKQEFLPRGLETARRHAPIGDQLVLGRADILVYPVAVGVLGS